MIRKITSGTRKQIWVNLFIFLVFVSFVILKWWVMAIGLLILTMITIFKELGEPKKGKSPHRTGNYSDSALNKRVGESKIEFPGSIDGTNLVAVAYKDEREINMW